MPVQKKRTDKLGRLPPSCRMRSMEMGRCKDKAVTQRGHFVSQDTIRQLIKLTDPEGAAQISPASEAQASLKPRTPCALAYGWTTN